MRRRPLLKWRFEASLNIDSCDPISYPVLSTVSSSYHRLKGRLPTCYSPVRHSTPKCCVRLACIRHAASVHPEPGSNSPLIYVLFSLAHLKELFLIRSCVFACHCSVFKDQFVRALPHALFHFITLRTSCQPLFFTFFDFCWNICP